MRKITRFKRFIIGKYWRFIVYNIVIYPVVLLLSIIAASWRAICAAAEEFIDAEYSLPLDRKTFNRLQRRYGVVAEPKLLKDKQ